VISSGYMYCSFTSSLKPFAYLSSYTSSTCTEIPPSLSAASLPLQQSLDRNQEEKGNVFVAY
jgi:hypothetical protein